MSTQSNPHPMTKYRPALTLAQLKRIVAHAKDREPDLDELDKSIIRIIVPLISKVEVGAINPAYKLSETHMQKQAEKSQRERYENDLMSPQEQAEYERNVLGV